MIWKILIIVNYFFFKPTFICLVSNSGLNFVTKVTMGKYGVQLSYSILLKPLR